jgi:hypothetical protein
VVIGEVRPSSEGITIVTNGTCPHPIPRRERDLVSVFYLLVSNYTPHFDANFFHPRLWARPSGSENISSLNAALCSERPFENPVALLQQKIMRILKQNGRISRRLLYRAVSADRVGTEIFQRALSGLVRDGMVLEFRGKRTDQTLYSLRKEQTDAT